MAAPTGREPHFVPVELSAETALLNRAREQKAVASSRSERWMDGGRDEKHFVSALARPFNEALRKSPRADAGGASKREPPGRL